jgi:hypothetical protein
MPSTLKKLRPLTDQFDLGDQYLSAPGGEPLKSAIISAHDKRDDQPVVLKYWQKTGSAVDDDLREIWQHEMRQAQRVLAYPGADKVIVELLRYGDGWTAIRDLASEFAAVRDDAKEGRVDFEAIHLQFLAALPSALAEAVHALFASSFEGLSEDALLFIERLDTQGNVELKSVQAEALSRAGCDVSKLLEEILGTPDHDKETIRIGSGDHRTLAGYDGVRAHQHAKRNRQAFPRRS